MRQITVYICPSYIATLTTKRHTHRLSWRKKMSKFLHSTRLTQPLKPLLRSLNKDLYSRTATSNTQIEDNPSSKCNFDYQERISARLGSNETFKLHPMWLRHHCRCEKCINYQTHQRKVIPGKLPAISVISDIYATDNKSLKIKWSDSHQSEFHLQWLKENVPSLVNKRYQVLSQKGIQKFNFQTTATDPLQTAVDYEYFMNDNDKGVAKLLENIIHHGYGIVNNSPPNFESTKDVIRKISHPQMTLYGDFVEWTNDLAFADTAYTSEYIYLHTDTSYFNEPMGLEMFHCLRHKGSGGINSLVDGFHIAKSIFEENESNYRVLSQFPVPYHYIDPKKHHFVSHDTVFSHNRITGEIERIRYNPHDIGIINTVPEEELGNFYEALVNLSERIEKNPTWIKLQPGLIILFDNWRTLHGRTEFTGSRHLCGAYIGRSDWTSKARVLQVLK